MRESNLLSPHRCRPRDGNPHTGEIITHAANVMRGTDAVLVFTVDDGWGWIFTAVEHWNAECVGWHVCKRGGRFAAAQPISMGLAQMYGSTSIGVARGRVRMSVVTVCSTPKLGMILTPVPRVVTKRSISA